MEQPPQQPGIPPAPQEPAWSPPPSEPAPPILAPPLTGRRFPQVNVAWQAQTHKRLESLLNRLRDTWELNPRFRARMSAFMALAAVVALCACAITSITATQSLLRAVGFGVGIDTTYAQPGGLGPSLDGHSFPTPSLNPWRNGATPEAGQIPASLTPQPSPTQPFNRSTPTPSVTVGPSPTPVTTCHGDSSQVSWAFSTCPPVHGQPITLTVKASFPTAPNRPVAVKVDFGSCSGCTVTPTSPTTLDSSGAATFTMIVPKGAANSSVPVSGTITIGGLFGPTIHIYAMPVQ